MNMKNDRLFLLGFVTVSFVLLTGFQKPADHKSSVASANEKKVKYHKKALNKPSVASADKDAELQKTLDLSLPSENVWLKVEPGRVGQAEASTMFTTEKKKPRPVYLDGKMLMSQEPEMDKQKSLDGAGIVITLKR